MKIKLLMAVICCLVIAMAVQASTTTDPATGDAKAEVITPVTLAHDGDATLNFGRMVVTSAGTVSVPADNTTGSAAYTGGVTLASGGDVTAAYHFTVSGLTSGVTYTVNLPASITLDLTTDNTKHLTVNSVTTNVSAGASAAEFYVGGTLDVPASVTEGTYTGTYNVTITY